MQLRKFIISLVTKYSGDGFAHAEKDIGKLGKAAKKTEKNVKDLDRAQGKASNSAAKLAQAERRAATAAGKAGTAAKKAGAAARKSGKDAKQGARDWSGFKEAATSVKDVAATLAKGIAVGAAGIVGVGAAVVKTGITFESLRARLKTVEGSAAGAGKAFATIQDFTKTTPFELEEVTTAYVRLKNLGLDATKESLRAFGNVAASQGKPITDFIEAVADASTGEFERLKEFGIKAKSEGDKVSFTFRGITTTVGKNAEEISGYLKQVGETQFAGAMDDQMATAAGAISNVKDAFMTFLDTVAQMGVLDEFKGLIGDLTGQFGDGEGFARLLADGLIKVIQAIRDGVRTMTREDITGAFQTFKDAALALADAIELVMKAFRLIINISGGFEDAVVNMTLVTVALVAAFQGPAGLVVAAAAAGAAIGNLLNRFGAADALADFLGDITGLNKQLAELDRRNGGTTSTRGAPKLRKFNEAGDLVEFDLAQKDYVEFTKGGKRHAIERETLLDVATGAVQGDALTQEEALNIFQQIDADDMAQISRDAAEHGAQAASKAARGKKKKKKGKKFFDFEKQIKDAARKQAEEFAQRELERLIAQGADPDEAIQLARQAGKRRASELEEQFRRAGKVFDASSKNILDVLGLRGPGSVLENRPPPQTLLITIAPVIKLIESMEINFTGTGGMTDEDRKRLEDAANQARDMMVAKLSDVEELVRQMFELQGKRLLASNGLTIPGVQ